MPRQPADSNPHEGHEHGRLNPLFTDPPNPGPIPEVLRRPVDVPATPELPGHAEIASLGAGWGMATEFLVTIIAGLGLGWLFDYWRHTAPIGILVGLGLGLVAGLVRIIRQSQASDRAEAAARARRRSGAR